MRQLSAIDIVRLCEWGRDKHAIDRALVLLRAASPQTDVETLARLPIGRRDALILELRQKTCGSKLELVVKCPACAEPLEFATTVEALTVPAVPGAADRCFEMDGFAIDYRSPDSRDLASVVGIADVLVARDALLRRCVRGARKAGAKVEPALLPEPVLAGLAARMAADDPQADLRFGLVCPRCRHAWSTVFDALSFFWMELEAHARQLQQEVHALAKAYGWGETQILAMSAPRRARYVELAGRG